MSLISIPLPRPVVHVQISKSQRLAGDSSPGQLNPLWGDDSYADHPMPHESLNIDTSHSIHTDDEGDFSGKPGSGDEIRLKALKHRILYLEQSLQGARDEAFKAGFSEAERIYLDRQEQEIALLQGDFHQLRTNLHKEYEALPDQLGPVVTEIVFRSVRIMVGELLMDEERAREVVSHQINSCLNRLVDQTEIRITVSQDQYHWLKSSPDLDRFKQSTASRVVVSSDPTLNAGECRVESDDFVLDGTLERQLANLRFDLNNAQSAPVNTQAPDVPSGNE